MNNMITYRNQAIKGPRLLKGLLSFYIACGIGAIVNIAVATILFETFSQWVLAGLLGAVSGAIWNFATTSFLTWGPKENPPP